MSKPIPDPLRRLEFDLDGHFDPKREGIRYLGKATRFTDDTWRVLADVYGALCVVEVKLRLDFGHPPSASTPWPELLP